MTYVYDQGTDTWYTRGRDAIKGTRGLGAPVASMSSSAAGLAVTFDGSSSTQPGGTITSWIWDFGDGGTGTGVNPSHTYASAGAKTVTLTVSGTSGLSATTTYSVQVDAVVVVAAFTATVGTGADTLRVNFDASASSVSSGTIASYDYDFGNGQTFHTTSPIANGFYYTAGGKYTVKLTVNASGGQTGSATKTVTVTAANVAPTLKASLAVGTDGVTVTGTSSAADSDGYVASIRWNWGDGTADTVLTGTATKPPVSTATHAYTTTGVKTVTTTATDEDGATTTVTNTVTATASSGTITQPTGAGISRIQDLSGGDLNTKLNSTTNQVSFPVGTYSFAGFPYPASQATNPNRGRGLNLSGPSALLGSGIDKTVIAGPGSTTKYADMTGSVIDLQLIYANSQLKTIKNLTILGNSIGDLSKLANGSPSSNGGGNKAQDSPYVYHSLYIAQISGLLVEDVKIKYTPGSDHVNPGESGAVCWYQGGASTWRRVELDGQNVGATGFLINNTTGASMVWEDCYVHGFKYSAGWSFYNAPGTHTVRNAHVTACRTAFNHESNPAGTVVNYYSPRIGTIEKSHFSFGSNKASVKANIYDPINEDGSPMTSIKATILSGYSTQQQVKSDVRVFQNGIDVSASVLKWS